VWNAKEGLITIAVYTDPDEIEPPNIQEV